jgi:hypothetical protein
MGRRAAIARAGRVLGASACCAVIVIAVGGGGDGARASTGAGWSAPITLTTRYDLGPTLAVDPRGDVLAAWVGGPPLPPVHFGPLLRAPNAFDRGHALFADLGSLHPRSRGAGGRGFAAPVLLTDDSSFGDNDIGEMPDGDVALSGSGVGYVAWIGYGTRRNAGPWMVSVEHDGRFARSRRLLPSSDYPLELVSGADGPVLAVWERALTPLYTGFYYARLGPDGRLGRTVAISNGAVAPSGPPVVSANDSGAIALAWLNGPFGGPDTLEVVVCDAAAHCVTTRSLKLFRRQPPAPAAIAVALDDAGQATVLSDGGNREPGSVRAAVSSGGRPFTSLPAVAGAAADPYAVADGAAGTLALFDNQADSELAVSTLVPGTAAFGAPRQLGFAVEEPPTLVSNLAGDFAVLGTLDGTGHEFVATGLGGAIGAPQRVIAATSIGIDAAGDVIVIGGGAHLHGVFAEIRRA